MEQQIASMETEPSAASTAGQAPSFDNAEDMLDRVVENAIVRSVFNQHDNSRRNFI
jgi:hypothetical protein